MTELLHRSPRTVDGWSAAGLAGDDQGVADEAAGRDVPLSDDELAALALAADPDAEVDPDAPSLWELDEPRPALLPSWYMPTAAAGVRRLVGWRRNVAIGLVGAFVAIDGAGMCTTFGPVIFGH